MMLTKLRIAKVRVLIAVVNFVSNATYCRAGRFKFIFVK